MADECLTDGRGFTNIKHISINSLSNYTYYTVDIRRNGKRFKKNFPFNLDGLNKAYTYREEILKRI